MVESSAPPSSADARAVVAPRRLTIAEAMVEFRQWATRYYGASREVDNLGEALRPLRERFGLMPLADLGPLQLRQLQNAWIEDGIGRNTINARCVRIRRFVKWCISHELCEPVVLTRLQAVQSIMPGRGGVEHDPKSPVEWDRVEATLPFLPEMVRAMVLFQWHCGARPREVTELTTGEIDMRGPVWVARLKRHKTAHHGHDREILIPRPGQEVLVPWLRPELPDEPIFSPLRVDDRQVKRASRKKNKRQPGRSYSRAAYQQVVRRACKRGDIQAWSPNMLRHAFGTRLTESHGIEVAQVALGHRKPDTTTIYTATAKKRAVAALGGLDQQPLNTELEERARKLIDELSKTMAEIKQVGR
jgi:integrase